ncbi:MAG: hypothetical protein IPG74_14555 [Flavobacteriales bacterium]|nr:hypothetical protein [Flavobacteriales bacterium]
MLHTGYYALRSRAIDPSQSVPRPWKWGFLFATGFHLVFFAMAVGFNLRYNLKFRLLEFALLIGNTATYYAVGMHFLTDAPSYPMQKMDRTFSPLHLACSTLCSP